MRNRQNGTIKTRRLSFTGIGDGPIYPFETLAHGFGPMKERLIAENLDLFVGH